MTDYKGLARAAAVCAALASPPLNAQQAITDPPPTPERGAATEEHPIAVLRALDKMAGQARIIEAATGAVFQFGALTVMVRACRAPKEGSGKEGSGGDAFVFLEIEDRRREAGDRRVFTGWMFASSPGLSALDHPRYDIWPLACKTS